MTKYTPWGNEGAPPGFDNPVCAVTERRVDDYITIQVEAASDINLLGKSLLQVFGWFYEDCQFYDDPWEEAQRLADYHIQRRASK